MARLTDQEIDAIARRITADIARRLTEEGAEVDEADRANLNVGQNAEVHVDGLPGGLFPATIKTVSGAASRAFFEAESRRKFETTLQLARSDERLRAGLTAEVVVSG